ncbi:MAG: hypothetical protein U9R29_09975 [Thermodesulfobacteriota bacterium]|nr:hypothetical protein [Thermodesulfobacteriota bacterium]
MQRLIRTSKQRDNYDCFVMAQQLVSFRDAIIFHVAGTLNAHNNSMKQ